MGQEAEAKARRRAFGAYQANERVVALAGPRALVMHCLPAHRGEEITDAVLDGPQSVAFEQAENRLHVQKAIMSWLAGVGCARSRRRLDPAHQPEPPIPLPPPQPPRRRSW